MESQNTNSHIRKLAKKWLDGTINQEEASEFETWYNDINTEESIHIPQDFAPSKEVHKQRMYGKIKQRIEPAKRSYRLTRIITMTAAAAALALVISIGNRSLNHGPANKAEFAFVAKAPVTNADIATNYTRHLTLPDGSTVILKAGSTLQYPTQFGGNTREVILAGEAYFDIFHDEQHKFKIHTGKITTTVLGTAFDITAWPKDQRIVVSVTRGKVRVENDQNILATLTRNEQVDILKENVTAEVKTVDADADIKAWTKDNMTFNHVALSEVCNTLSKRYGMEFIIEDSHTASAMTYLSFNGTEPIKNILEIICMIIPDTKYQITDNKTILISTLKEKKGERMKR